MTNDDRPDGWYRNVARGTKAAKLVAVFRSIDLNAEDVGGMAGFNWETAADAAGVPLPSDETRAIVLGILKADGKEPDT